VLTSPTLRIILGSWHSIGKTYLDHAGTTVYARSVVEDFSQKLTSNLYGNPHSACDPAELSGHAVDSIREQALRFFRADPEDFDLVFTANATAAIKLVAESFRDLAASSSTSGTFWYGYHKDSHTSLVGVRELTNGTHHCFNNDQEVEEWLEGAPRVSMSAQKDGLPGLFAYPGQSNMTGRRRPLSWTKRLRQSTDATHQSTYSLLDAAALATTTQLDFSDPDSAPDFTALSFYKIFGFPDLGALIVRRKSGHILSWRKYFGGGTINALTVLHESTFRRKDDTIHDGLEDGTLPFHNIVALGCAINAHKKLYGSMKIISQHTLFLSNRLYTGISSLRHSNGRPLCVIYNDSSDAHPYTDPTTQGATIAFNVLDINGNHIGYSHVEKVANQKAIYLRAGGLCNPGGIASYLKVEPWQFKRAWSAGYRCGGADSDSLEIINGKPTGVVRASLGAMSLMAEVDRLIVFLSDAFKDTTAVGTSGVKFDMLPQRATPTTESSPVAIQSHHCNDDDHSLVTQSSRSMHSRGSLSINKQILYVKQSLRRLRHVRVVPKMAREKEPKPYLNVDPVDQRDPRMHAEAALQMLVHGTQGRRSVRKGTLKFWRVGRVQSK
jgi:molybdenum cofactor sulfurtransferase